MSEPGLLYARTEVAWFFSSAAAAMGLHAQSYDSGGGGGAVWDDARCDRLHDSQLSVVHRQSVVRYGRVLETMRALAGAGGAGAGAGMVRDLRRVYEPFGVGRVSWQALGCFTDGDRQLLGLVLAMPDLGRAYATTKAGQAGSRGAGAGAGAGARAGRVSSGADQAHLLAFVTDEVTHLDHTLIAPGHALPVGHVLEPVLAAAKARELVVVEAYESLRSARVRGEQAASEQYYDDLRSRI